MRFFYLFYLTIYLINLQLNTVGVKFKVLKTGLLLDLARVHWKFEVLNIQYRLSRCLEL